MLGLVAVLLGTIVPQGARAQAPGLVWKTTIRAKLFAIDAQTNLYANADGNVIVLNSAGVPQQTNAVCPIDGLARRDSQGNYYYAGLLDGTQDFGGIILTGGFYDPMNRGAWVPGHPSCFLASYTSNSVLNWAVLFGSLTGTQYGTNAISDLVLDGQGGAYIGYHNYQAFMAHFSGQAKDWEIQLSAADPLDPHAYAFPKIGSVTTTNCSYFAYLAPGASVPEADFWRGQVSLGGVQKTFPFSDNNGNTNGRPVMDALGQLLAASNPTLPTPRHVLRKYTTGGALLWELDIGSENQWTLANDPQANIYLGGDQGLLSKRTSDGTLIWSTRLDVPCNELLLDGSSNRFPVFADGSFGLLQPDPPAVPPSVTISPGAQTVFTGDVPTLSASATGSPPLSYIWYFNGTAIGGASSSTLALSNASPANSGSYTVRIDNPAGSVTSAPALLRVKSVEFYLGDQLLTNGVYAFSSPPTVSLRSAFSNGNSFFTVDGSSPTFTSTRYYTPLVISNSGTIRGIGYSSDFTQSEEADAITVMLPELHSLTASCSGGGTLALNPPGTTFASTELVTVTAQPSPGWFFLYWLGDASGTNPAVSVSMERDKALRAVFGTTLSTTATGGGSVLLNPAGGIYPYGTVVRLTAVPSPGNFFGAWGNAATGNLSPLDFTVTNANQTVSSVFGPIPSGQAALTVLTDGNGKATVAPASSTYNLGGSVVLTAVPDAGQTFLNWTGDVTGSQNPLSVSMSQDRTITAHFTARPRLRADRLGLEGMAGTGFRFTLVSPPTSAWQILSSTNLATWEPLGVITNDFGEIQFTDSSASTLTNRFYKAVAYP